LGKELKTLRIKRWQQAATSAKLSLADAIYSAVEKMANDVVSIIVTNHQLLLTTYRSGVSKYWTRVARLSHTRLFSSSSFQPYVERMPWKLKGRKSSLKVRLV